LFFYHLYRKLSRERYRSILALLESEAKGLKEENSDPVDYLDQREPHG
jgi:hypothetical protein